MLFIETADESTAILAAKGCFTADSPEFFALVAGVDAVFDAGESKSRASTMKPRSWARLRSTLYTEGGIIRLRRQGCPACIPTTRSWISLAGGESERRPGVYDEEGAEVSGLRGRRRSATLAHALGRLAAAHDRITSVPLHGVQYALSRLGATAGTETDTGGSQDGVKLARRARIEVK